MQPLRLEGLFFPDEEEEKGLLPNWSSLGVVFSKRSRAVSTKQSNPCVFPPFSSQNMSQLRYDLSSPFTSSTAVSHAACRKPTSSPFYLSSFSALPSYSPPSRSPPSHLPPSRSPSSHSLLSHLSCLAMSPASSSPSLSTSYCTSFHYLCHSERYANNVTKLHHTRRVLVSLPSHSPHSHSPSSRLSRLSLSPASSSPSLSTSYCTSFHCLCHSESYANNDTNVHHTHHVSVSPPSHSPHPHSLPFHSMPSLSSCLIRHHTCRVLLAIILVTSYLPSSSSRRVMLSTSCRRWM
jgi:hypothetical protein